MLQVKVSCTICLLDCTTAPLMVESEPFQFDFAANIKIFSET